MTKTQSADAAVTWLKGNGLTIGLALLAGYTGYLSAMNSVQNDIQMLQRDMVGLQKDIAIMKAQLLDRREFMGCAVRTIDQITDELDLKQRCPLKIAE